MQTTATLRIRQAEDQYLIDLPNGDHWSLFPEADGDPAVLRKHPSLTNVQASAGVLCPPVFPEWVLTGSDWDTDLCCALYTLGQKWETRPTILCAGSEEAWAWADTDRDSETVGCDVCGRAISLPNTEDGYVPDHDTEGELA